MSHPYVNIGSIRSIELNKMTMKKAEKSSIDRLLLAATILDQFWSLVALLKTLVPAASITYGRRDNRRVGSHPKTPAKLIYLLSS
jgi:hypothetical protein